jgi:hypothetical protein
LGIRSKQQTPLSARFRDVQDSVDDVAFAMHRHRATVVGTLKIGIDEMPLFLR